MTRCSGCLRSSRSRLRRGGKRRMQGCSRRRCDALRKTWTTSTGAYAVSSHRSTIPSAERSFTDITSKWVSNRTSWVVGRRAPRLDEDQAATMSLPISRSRRALPAPQELPRRPEAVPARGRSCLRLQLVLGHRRRHPIPGRVGRRVHQGRVEVQPRLAPGPERDGTGGWPRRPQSRRRSAWRASAPTWSATTTRTWADSSTSRTQASAASRSTCATRADSTSPSG